MLLRSLESILAGKTPEIGRRWLVKIRKSENLRGLGVLGDSELLAIHNEVMGKLARWFEKEAGKNEIGGFFVGLGKEYCSRGIPISELTMAFVHLRKIVTDYLLEVEDLEGAHRIYALMEAVDSLSDFYMFGSYYLTKGFLEETFLKMSAGEKLSKEVIGKYLKDDFFFK
jgi:hypothetical protein